MTSTLNLEIYELVIFIALCLAVLFFGYRIKRIAFFIIWFLLGLNLMQFLMPMINDNVPEVANSELYQNLLPIAGGLLLGLLGFSIEKLCVSGITFVLVMLITIQYFGTDIATLIIGGVIGLAAGGIAVMLIRPAIIISSSLVGGYGLTLAIFSIFPEINFDVFYWPILFGISLIGIIFQFMSTKHLK